MFGLSKKSKDHMRGVDPRLIEVAEMAITITKVDFGIPDTGGARTAPEQNVLFKAGSSKCDGYRKESKHQKGMALDFFAYYQGKASWDKLNLAMVALAFMQAANNLGYKLKWGGLWAFQDMPHVELVE